MSRRTTPDKTDTDLVAQTTSPDSEISARIEALGIKLPKASDPIANYVRFRQVGSIVYVSGQGSITDADEGIFGKLGQELSIEDGKKAARMAAMNLLSQTEIICEGDFDRVLQWIKLTGYVSCVDNFYQQPEVLDGATQLLEEVFGEAGLVARAAVGVNSLPMNIAVEIQANFELKS